MEKVVKDLAEMTDYKNKSAISRFWGLIWRRKFRIIFLSGLSYAW
jgi:hypothetical protein